MFVHRNSVYQKYIQIFRYSDIELINPRKILRHCKSLKSYISPLQYNKLNFFIIKITYLQYFSLKRVSKYTNYI